MRYLAGIFALMTGAAGWFYLFYSRAAQRLAGIEEQRLNQRRIALRRTGGIVMLLLGGFFFAGFWQLDQPTSRSVFAGVWLTVLALLIAIVVLAIIDLRLTRKLRSSTRQKESHFD